ncbi:LysR family transcriptional regulator [Xinfangfangia sp. D13-10-4-6]|uniref:LysR family transcriptional regulator n=1 Tax=Pseudogemmobacter hezensis TaxID=2737662 RepID=UPI001554FFF7|nr:LysR family transcriptional regulator [Pseudogemmobacter hezensis]NPD13673.1 LysR family transcriptional regulator [Pseudogemmobacter hezensis]
MLRNLDLTALRSFVMVAELGGVTRAAGSLFLTQSAVSMQIRRLEEALDLQLFLRAGRKMLLSPEGEMLLSYGRRMLELNDEALSRLGHGQYEGEIRLGVPYDIVYPAIPPILKRLSQNYPLMRINLVSSYTLHLKEYFEAGKLDLMLTTEERPDPEAEVLHERQLLWIGAVEGSAWQRRPLRLGFKQSCLFRPLAQAALDQAGIPWEMAVDGDSEQVIEASVAADLAVTVRIGGGLPDGTQPISGENTLPQLGRTRIALYTAEGFASPRVSEVGAMLISELRAAYGAASA